MKSTLYGGMNLIFAMDHDHTDKDMAFLQSAYLVDDSIIRKVEVTVTNVFGQEIVLNVKEWDTTLLELYNEDGILIE